jgi:hypothetical protein
MSKIGNGAGYRTTADLDPKPTLARLACAGSVALLSACATQVPVTNRSADFAATVNTSAIANEKISQQATGGPPTNTGKPTPREFQLVRYIGSDSSQWKPVQAPLDYSDLYSRIELDVDANHTGAGQDQSTAALRDYQAENRSWLARLVSNETDTVTTLANIEIRDPELKLAVPLFSVSHASGRDLGNTWSTNFTASNIESPLFRIGPNTGLTVHLDAKASRDLKSQGAALVVSAVQTAVSIAAPQSTLLTALSKSDVSNTANAIDTAISGLASNEISEDIELGRLTDSWNANAELTLYGCAPFVRGESLTQATPDGSCGVHTDLDAGYDQLVGKWHLKLACPRVSAFSSRDLDCQAETFSASFATKVEETRAQAVAKVSDAQVLQFNLSSQTDVQTFVKSQSWFTTFIATKTTSNTDKTAADYSAFCSGAMVGLEANGLNQFDSALVLRAMVRQMPQISSLRPNFTLDGNGKDCVTLFQEATGSTQTTKL